MKVDEDFTVDVFEEEKFWKQNIFLEPLDLSKHDFHSNPSVSTSTDSKEITIEEHPVKTEFGSFSLVPNTQNETRKELCDNFNNKKFTSKEVPKKNNQSSVKKNSNRISNLQNYNLAPLNSEGCETNRNRNSSVISYNQDLLNLHKQNSVLPVNNNRFQKTTLNNDCQNNQSDQTFMEPVAKKICLPPSESSNFGEKTGPFMTPFTSIMETYLQLAARMQNESTTIVKNKQVLQNTGNQLKSKETVNAKVEASKSVIVKGPPLLKTSEFSNSRIETSNVNVQSGINTNVTLEKKNEKSPATKSSNISKGAFLLKKVCSSGEFFDTTPRNKVHQNKSLNQQKQASRLVGNQLNSPLPVQKQKDSKTKNPLPHKNSKHQEMKTSKSQASIDINIPQYSLLQKNATNVPGVEQTIPDQNELTNSAIVQNNSPVASSSENSNSLKINTLLKRLLLEKDPEEQIRISKSLTEALNTNDVWKERSKPTEISTNVKPSKLPQSPVRRKNKTGKDKRASSRPTKPKNVEKRKNLTIERNSSASEFQSPQAQKRKAKKSVSGQKKKANEGKDLPIYLPISPDLLTSLRTYVNNKSTENSIQISNDSTNPSSNKNRSSSSTRTSLTVLPPQEGEISSTDQYKQARVFQKKKQTKSTNSSEKKLVPISVTTIHQEKPTPATVVSTPKVVTLTADSTSSNVTKDSPASNHLDETIICLSDSSSDEEDNDVHFVPLTSSDANVGGNKNMIPPRIQDKISDLINSVMNEPNSGGSKNAEKPQPAPVDLSAKSPPGVFSHQNQPSVKEQMSNYKLEILKPKKGTSPAKLQAATSGNSSQSTSCKNRDPQPPSLSSPEKQLKDILGVRSPILIEGPPTPVKSGPQNPPELRRGRPPKKTLSETTNFQDIPIMDLTSLPGFLFPHQNQPSVKEQKSNHNLETLKPKKGVSPPKSQAITSENFSQSTNHKNCDLQPQSLSSPEKQPIANLGVSSPILIEATPTPVKSGPQNPPKPRRGRPPKKTLPETNFQDIPITPVLAGVTNEHINETFNTVTEFLNGMLNPGPPPSTFSNFIGQVYAYRYGEQISQHFKQ